MTIKTHNFTYDLIENYFLKNLTESEFWVFGSRSTRTEVPRSQNTIAETVDVLAKTVFGKKLETLDYSFMIKSVFWVQDTVYTKYDSNVELAGKNFYVIVEPESETGSYDVFKCISNSYNNPSTVKPQSNQSINQIGGVYNLPDGYVWKFMTAIPFQIYKKFAARGYVPIPRNAQIEQLANDGIDFIEVLNPESNSGYQILEGNVNSKTLAGAYLLDIPTTFYEATNIYRDAVLYVETQDDGAKTYKILGSQRVGQRLEVTIDGDVYTDFDSSQPMTAQVLPQILITGNGSGAAAIPVFNVEKTRIISIRMLDSGSGYTQSSAEIVAPSYFIQLESSGVITAQLRSIISPPGGHGSNVIRELRSNSICLSASISATGNTNIVDTGSYTTLALVKNPAFDEAFSENTFDNRLELVLTGTSPTSLLIVGDVVVQTRSGETITGTIHEIVDANTIKLVDYEEMSSIGFDESAQIVVRNNSYTISEINRSSYESGSGDVFYITDFLPVERTPDKTEQIKVILEF